jgi:hypothetical protein
VDLGELARHHYGTLAHRFHHCFERFENAVRRFIEDQRRGFAGKRFEGLQTLSCLGREKAAEIEGLGGKTRSRDSGQHGGRARHRLHADARVDRGAHQPVSRVRHQRHSCIRNQRHYGARAQAFEQLGGPLRFVVLVITHGRLLDAVMIEKLAGLTRVFARDHVGLLQQAHGTERDVFQITDRRRDQIEQSGHSCTLS